MAFSRAVYEILEDECVLFHEILLGFVYNVLHACADQRAVRALKIEHLGMLLELFANTT